MCRSFKSRTPFSKATAGDPHLGGEDFDNRMLSHCINDFRRKYKSDPSKNQRAIRRLRTQCERAKRQLSTQTQVTIEVDALHEGNDFNMKMSRAKFEELNMDYFKKAMEPVTQCLQDSGLDKKAIKEVVMVGGSTRIPKVQEMISAFFGGKELCKDINPDEAVAYGAAVQAAIVTGQGSAEVQNMLLLDVAPLSLGIEMQGGMMQKLIERNSTIPTNKSQDFTTAEDDQEFVEIKVYEGERPMVKDNNFLGKFVLRDLPKTKRGVIKIKVTFNIDSNGIMEVTAEDVRSHNKCDIRITNEKGRLTQAQIEKMLDDADKFKEEDDLAIAENVARETFKAYVLRVESSAEDIKEKLSKRLFDRLQRKLEEAKEWLKNKGERATKTDLEIKHKELETTMNSLMQQINKPETDFGCLPPATLPEGEKLLTAGGWFLECGEDIRLFIEAVD